jgi:branched-chain amino acid transport system ATP-binding protein
VLELHGLTRRYGGVLAVSDVSFAIPRQQVFGIIGPNGAGKTTLLNLISGVARPTNGRILLDGARIDQLPAYGIARRGIARTFQQIRLLRESSVLEQLIVAQHRRGRGRLWQELIFSSLTRGERAGRRRRAEALLELVRLQHLANRPAGLLSYGDQRRLEIARALAQAPEYLLLDEPAAGLNEQETRDLERLFAEIGQNGVTVVLVEHDVNLVMDVCDRVAVLNFGRLLAEGPVRDIATNPEVIRAYLGDLTPTLPGPHR